MALSTVTHAQRRAGDAQVNNKSGFSLKAWLFGAPERADDPFAPDEQSRWIADQVRMQTRAAADLIAADMRALVEQQAKPRTAAASGSGTHPTALLRELVHLALDLEVRKDLDHRMCVEALRPTMERFSQGAVAEQKAQETIERRRRRAAAAAGAAVEGLCEVVAAQEAANGFAGVTVTAEVDTGVYGRELGAAFANVHAVSDETATFEPIRADMPDPRVRVTVETTQPGDVTASSDPAGLPTVVRTDAPPVPTEAAPGPDPLPHRPARLTAFEARLDEHAQFIDGGPVEASELPALVEGVGPLWLAHRGFWHRIESARVHGAQIRVTLDGGLTDCPEADAVVHVLSDVDARSLRTQAVAK